MCAWSPFTKQRDFLNMKPGRWMWSCRHFNLVGGNFLTLIPDVSTFSSQKFTILMWKRLATKWSFRNWQKHMSVLRRIKQATHFQRKTYMISTKEIGEQHLPIKSRKKTKMKSPSTSLMKKSDVNSNNGSALPLQLTTKRSMTNSYSKDTTECTTKLNSIRLRISITLMPNVVHAMVLHKTRLISETEVQMTLREFI